MRTVRRCATTPSILKQGGKKGRGKPSRGPSPRREAAFFKKSAVTILPNALRRSMMNAADVMTHPVYTVAPDTSIVDAARLMLAHHVSGLPVVDADGKLVGILTEGDLLRRAETGTEQRRPRWLEIVVGPGFLAQEYVDAHARRVEQVMTENVASVTPQTRLSDLVHLMEKRRIKRLPVVVCGRVVGIVSRADLVHALVSAFGSRERAPHGDDEIRGRILNEIANQPWGPRTSVAFAVSQGVVELTGTILDDRERTALKVLVENVPGVKSTDDHLVWVDPVSGTVVPAP
jgi:CBS domain-containing protein